MSPKKLIFLLLLLSTSLSGQEYLGGDRPFFEKKAKLFQHWLEAKGLGAWLKVDTVLLKKNDRELEILLSMYSTLDTDTAALYWTEMKKAFAEKNGNRRLEETLFSTYIRMMEVDPNYANMQIYVPSEGLQPYDTCFYIWIWEEDQRLQDESKLFGCLRAQPLNIPVETERISSLIEGESFEIKGKQYAKIVFDSILSFARQKYEVQKCSERRPRVEEDEMSDYQLTFAVSDLCQEVLKDEQKSLWCKFVEYWGGTCNDTRRERLNFTFNFIPTVEGYTLTGSLTGKFGSGVYVPRRSGYMDMEPDFEEDFLKPYVKTFQKELKQYLLNSKP